MPDGKSFLDRTTLDCDSVVCVYLNNGEWIFADKGKFVGTVVVTNVDLVVYLELVAGATFVGLQKTTVNKRLTVLCQCDDVGDDGNVKKHVALEDKGTRRIVAERTVGRASMRMHGCSKRFINQSLSVTFVSRRSKMNESANDLSNGLMDSFNDTVGSSSVGRDMGTSETGGVKKQLEVVIFKLGTSVVNGTGGPGIARQPVVFEETFGSKTGFGTRVADNFEQIGNGIDHSKGIKGQFKTVDCNRPRTDGIEMDFGPRKNGSFTGSKLTVRRRRDSDHGTDGTFGDNLSDGITKFRMIEEAADHGIKAVKTSRVDSGLMVPTHNGKKTGVR